MTTWRKITENVLNKAETNRTLASYYRDHKDKYMCSNCYNMIVVNRTIVFKEHIIEYKRELKRHRKNDSLSMSESISLLINIIIEREIIGNVPSIVSFFKFQSIVKGKNEQLSFFFDEIKAMTCLEKKNDTERKVLDRFLAYQCYLMCWNQSMIILLWNLKDEKYEKELAIYSFKQLRIEMVTKDFRLSSFFNSIYNASLSKNNRSDKYLEKLDKKLVMKCYIICSNQNFKLTIFKKDILLFVDLMRILINAIDVLSHASIMISQRHFDRKKTTITNNHLFKINSYLESKKNNTLVLKIDDYHNIYTE
ncbi:5637_t:CDS:2 [Cetraspora pellucida]|uniref:5637_t:CDS:1 n=1 Tax=Cetraspora pellucida TaxID=1433469 RepID=A0A9N9BCK9_9GLOM|nr:5637_t:CDS:2 [Cetraspora pellucida]